MVNHHLEQMAQALINEKFSDENYTHSYVFDELTTQIKPGTNYQPKRVEQGIPFLNIRNIRNNDIDLQDVKYITPAEYERVHKQWKPEKNDILISRIGTLGLVARIDKSDLPIAVHYNFINIKAGKLPHYVLYFLLQSDYFQEKYHLIKKQSVQEYVTIDDVKLITIASVDSIDSMDFTAYKSLFSKIMILQEESKSLVSLRDSLLPKLMSGELSVADIQAVK